MAKLSRTEFVAQHADSRIVLKDVKNDPVAKQTLADAGLTVEQLAKADLSKNGVIAGTAELTAVFKQVDRFDRDGKSATFDVTDASGNLTKAGKVMAAITPNFTSARAAVARAALDLVSSSKQNYGVDASWRSPNPGIPTNQPVGKAIGGTQGRWKCNLFGGDALYNAGFVPPTYGTNGKGWYSIAVDFHKFTTGANPIFKSLGSLDLKSMTDPAAKQAAVNKLLAQAEPGDFIMVTHPGGAGRSDGGHTRVVVKNEFAANGTVQCAQASFNEAVVRNQSVYDFTGEDAMYLLRPARQRTSAMTAALAQPAPSEFSLLSFTAREVVPPPRWEDPPDRNSAFARTVE